MVVLSIGWAAVTYPGLSEMGLWDPWEMNRAQMARQMNDAPSVFVVEPIESGESLGPIGSWLAARYQSNLQVSSVDPPVSIRRKGKTKTKAQRSVNLDKALTRLDALVVQMVVIDVTALIPETGSQSSVKAFTEWLNRVQARNPGVPCLLVVRSEKADSVMAALRTAVPAARARLAANDLTGQSWGRAGAFRKTMHTQLRNAAKDGYSPIHQQLIDTDEPETFLEEGFWDAAKQHRLTEAMSETLPEGIRASLQHSEIFALDEVMVSWPSDEEYQSLRANFSAASADSRQLMETFETKVDTVFGSLRRRAALKQDGHLRTAPPLDSWLVAHSMRLFGFSERAVRLPSFLLGLMGVLLLYWIVWRVWDGRVAILSGLVLITCPLYFAQGHLVASELSFVVALMLMLGGLLFLIEEQAAGGQAFLMLLAGGLMAFFSQGVYGLIFPTTIALMYLVIIRKVSLQYLTTTLLLTLALSLVWLWTQSASSGSFWAQFGIQNSLAEWNINAADRPVDLNFDVLIRQIGFGAAPWSALLPLAFAGLIMQRIPEGKRPAVLVALWFVVPYVIQSILLKDCTHLVFPAIPALAVAVGLLLDRLLRGQGLGLIGGVIVLVLSGILINELKRTPEPLTSFVTVDPPMYGKTDTIYPEDLKLSKLFLGVLGLMAVMFLVHAGRLGTRARRVLRALGSPKAFWVLLGSLLTFLTIRFVMGLEGHIADVYAAGGPAGHLESVHRLFVRSVLYWRPETWAVAVFGLGLLGATVWHHTRFFSLLRGWIGQWVLNLPVVYVIVLCLGLTTAFLGLDNSRDVIGSVVAHGAFPAAVIGLIVGFALILSATRSNADTSFVRWVLLAALIRVFVRPGSEWLAGWELSTYLGSYALFEALFVASIAGILCLICWGLSRRSHPMLSRLALLGAAMVLALPTVDSTTPWDLVVILVSRMVLMATILDLFQGVDIVRALGQRVPSLEFLIAPLAGLATVCIGVVIGAALLAVAVIDESLIDDSMVMGLAISTIGLVTVMLTGIGIRKTRMVSRFKSRAAQMCFRPWNTVVGTVKRWQSGRKWLVGGSVVTLALLALAMERVLSWGVWTDDFVAWATWKSPLVWVGVPVLLGWTMVAILARWPVFADRVLTDKSWLGFLRSASQFRVFWLGAMLLITWILGGCVAQLFRGSGQTLTDYMILGDKSSPEATALLRHSLTIGGLMAGAALVGVLSIWRLIGDNRRFAIGAIIVTGLVYALILVAPLCHKWLQLESRVVSNQAEPFLAYLFGKSRVSMALYGLILGAIGLRFITTFPQFLERLRSGRRQAELVCSLIVVGTVGTVILWGRTESMGLRLAPLLLALVLVVTVILAARPAVLLRLLGRLRSTGMTLAVAAFICLVAWAGLQVVGGQARTAWVAVGIALFGLALNWLSRWIPPHRAVELVERPRVFVPIVALFAFAFAFLYNNQLVNALSYHVSQKHILETVQQSESGDDYRDRLYQTGIGKSSTDNFYTRDIPSVRSQDVTKALRALSGRSDQVLPVMLAGKSIVEDRLIRVFSADNDSDSDGHRDHPADAGLFSGHNGAERWAEDLSKKWTEDQWKGQWLIDSDGWIFPVTSNTENRIYYDPSIRRLTDKKDVGARGRKSPRFSQGQATQNRYLLDAPESADHTASALVDQRLYFLLPKVGQRAPAYSDSGSFSDLNHQYRKLSGGRHLKVLDDRSSQILLATNAMRSGEQDKNWLRDATMDEASFLSRVKRGLIRGSDPMKPLSGIVNWEKKLLLLGWSMDRYALSKGQTLRIHLYFKVLKPLTQSMKIFMHIDRAGHRIHGDHWPHPVKKGKEGKHCIGCFQTNHWLPGDIVVDTFEQDVPIGAPSGTTDIWMGFFNPQNDKRLPVTKWDRKSTHYPGKDNRVRVGSFEVR